MTAVRGQLVRLARVARELHPTRAAVRKALRAARRRDFLLWYEALTIEDIPRLETLLSRPGCGPVERFQGQTVGAIRVGLAESRRAECRELLAGCAARGGGPPDVCGEVRDHAEECMDRLLLLREGRYPGCADDILEDLRGAGLNREAALTFLDEAERVAPFED